MNRRQHYYIFWATTVTGAVLIGLGIFFYMEQFGLEKYTDREAGFSIRFPREWAYGAHKDGALAIFYSPAESDYDQFVENVNISIHNISRNPMAIKEYSEVAIGQMETLFGQDLEVIESTEMYLGGRQGHRFIFAGRTNGGMKMMICWAMKGEDVYQVTYTALADTFNFYLPQVQRMIKSFRIL